MTIFNKKYFTAVLTLVCFSILSLEAKSTIGGIIFTNTYYSDMQDDTQRNDISKLKVVVPTNSRLRIRWDNEDNVGMYLESGFGSGTTLNVRHAYGKWNISEEFQILVGHTSTPFAPLNPQVSMVHNSGDGFGNANPSRQSQVRFTYKLLNKQGAISVAILDPNSGEEYDYNTTTGIKLKKESSIPRIDIGAVYKTFNLQIFPSGFYTQTSFEDTLDSVESWGASLGVRTAYKMITFSAEVAKGQNWGNTKMSDVDSVSGTNRNSAFRQGNKLLDNNVKKAWADLGIRFAGNTLKGEFHIIAGYDHSNVVGENIQEFENTMYGISVPIDMPWIARGFRLRPEIFEFKEIDKINSNANRKETIAGIQVQITF